MKICFISNEIFAFGKYGGFGRATRIIGGELVKAGHDVYAVIPRRGEQKKHEVVDGIKVQGYEINNPFGAIPLLKTIDADIYHSEEPSFMTLLARVILPTKRHVITFRDTRNLGDWWLEFIYPSKSHIQVIKNYIYEDSFLTHIGVRAAHMRGAASRFLIDKARKKYHLKTPPVLLPTPVRIPGQAQKSPTPVAVFISRLDRRKQPHLFLELAGEFPDVKFQVLGKGQDLGYAEQLRKKYSIFKNVEFLDLVDQFSSAAFSQILGSAWILVNTSVREGLPNTFLEAASYRCAILSKVDPDSFATNFGYHAADGDFAAGLRFLLEGDKWQEKGMAGYSYVKDTYEVSKAIGIHLEYYRNLLGV